MWTQIIVRLGVYQTCTAVKTKREVTHTYTHIYRVNSKQLDRKIIIL